MRRLAPRILSVMLLVTGVAGGVYLSQDRAASTDAAEFQAAYDAQRAEEQYLKARHREYTEAVASQHDAARRAAERAAQTAKDQAQRATAANDAATRKAEREKEKKQQQSTAIKPYDGPVPESCNQYSGHKKTGCALMLGKGFGLDQFPCLDKLWTKESHWNPKAANPSGAYGIPQARPGSKMSSVADDWRTNPATQITWGLGYIKGRYSTPCKAWSHSQAKGWY